MSFSRELQANFETVPTSLTFSFKDTSTGILTRTLWWPAKAGDPSAILVFVCGNPGIPVWYIDFLNSIRDRVSNSSLAILAIGHVGHAHDLPQPPSDASLSLQVQIDVANATRRRLLQLFPNVPHIVIGHSIGAYIALQPEGSPQLYNAHDRLAADYFAHGEYLEWEGAQAYLYTLAHPIPRFSWEYLGASIPFYSPSYDVCMAKACFEDLGGIYLV
ncbi:hypothetical protein FS842_003911 [Serendipita sp. 407]|nr:hypothetical protein FS842_003911 [Serendipita sp. 407]